MRIKIPRAAMRHIQQRVQDYQNRNKRALLRASVDKKRQSLVTELMACTK